MMRALYSGVSGLRTHQTKMDVIGNNISNVNTAGFRGSNVNFSDVYYQTTQYATGPNPATGSAGRNPQQIGLGSQVASITANMDARGGSQRTDNPFDVMINGDGFFIVNSGGVNYFTKAGAFGIDADGNLCTASGAKVMGWQPNNEGTGITKDTVSPLQLMSPGNMYSPPEATTEAYVSGNIDKKDTEVVEDGRIVTVSFYDSLGTSYTARMKVKQTADKDNEYEMTLDDVVDAKGNSIFSKKKADGTYEASAITTVKFGGVDYTVDTLDTRTGAVTLKGTGTVPKMVFNSGGGAFDYVGAAGQTALDLTIVPPTGTTDANNPYRTVSVDFSSITMYDTAGESNLESDKGNKTTHANAGRKVGNMLSLGIDGNGKVYGTYDNGDKRLLGQIAIATFPNPSGLEAVGNSMFAATQNSGEFDGIGKDPTADGGDLQTGVLEMSNVDLSNEFTSMITTQRGFQANSRIITTSDTLLEELINLKR